jgi:hypothetical protein
MRLMSRSMTTAAVMYAFASPSASAQAARPNLSGVWVMDASKTIVTGQIPAPTAVTSTITQHGDTLIVDREVSSDMAGAVKTHLLWATDGKPWKNTVPVNGQDTDVSTVLSWDNGTLVARTTLSIQGTDVEQVDRWTLSSDGKNLLMVRSVSVGGQDYGSVTTTNVKKT